MDSPLQKAPLGLLDILTLRTQGQMPTLFGDKVTPVLDVLDYYVADQIRQTSNASAGEVAASSVTLQVDTNAIWLLRSITARWDYAVLSNSADEQWRWSLQYLPAGSGGLQLMFGWKVLNLPVTALALPLGAAATFSESIHVHFERPFLLRPGTILQASASSAMSAGSYSSSIRAEFIPLRI